MATPDSTTQRVAKRLRALRRERDMTQVDVAEKAKMSSMYYSKIERGIVKPSVEMYERIAKALKVTSSDIFPF
ncbi:MAG: helix-turn-helix transcriptional regulator [Candidatus Saccharimonadales bacterium]